MTFIMIMYVNSAHIEPVD